MKVVNALLASAGLFVAARTVAAPMPVDQAAKLFAARPSGFGADLSPSGNKFLYLAAGPGSTTDAHVVDLTTKQDVIAAHSSGKPDELMWCGFTDERWIICGLGGEVADQGQILGIRRTIAIDTMTGKLRMLNAADHLAQGGFVQSDGEILDWLPNRGGTVLMERARPNVGPNGEEGYSVDQIQIDPFKASTIESTVGTDVDYLTDGRGSIRLKGQNELDEMGRYTGKRGFQYRRVGSSEWVPLPEGGKDFEPLAVDATSNALYFLKPYQGREALFTIKLDGTDTEALVASNPKVDIDSVIRSPSGDRVVGYSYTDDRSRSVYFDAAAKMLDQTLSQALPDMPLISPVAQSQDGSKLLIQASSDVDAGAYYLLDRNSMQMNPILESQVALRGVALAPMKSVTIPTSDGKSVPAYVTMRSDLGSGPHPAVVLPHGGPSSRDVWGYDWLSQFLASRGYVVIQPNFRGSSGYGQAFLGHNAFQDWRKVMADIRDSADWLVKQGLADPNRMAILGWSYGGYAALESAALDPRYKAVVAIAPVTDIKELRSDTAGFRSEILDKNEIGKGDQLDEGSPINHAADIHAPVLLVHGTLDGNVAYEQSKRMAGALTHAGDKAELLTFAGLDHQLDDSDARTEMLTKIGQLLDRTIGE